jgi:hypothetical protein
MRREDEIKSYSAQPTMGNPWLAFAQREKKAVPPIRDCDPRTAQPETARGSCPCPMALAGMAWDAPKGFPKRLGCAWMHQFAAVGISPRLLTGKRPVTPW